MSDIIIQNKKRTIELNKFPSYEEIELIKYSHPNLKNIVFENAIIPDFSLLENLKNYNLYFINSNILEQNYPITLNGTKISFENTRVDFRKFFFMTNMPNLEDIGFLYDSIEGVNLYKPYLKLLKFFPFLERIRLLMLADMTYYDMDHTKEYEEPLVTNMNLLYYVNIWKDLEFLTYLPFYKFKTQDGLCRLSEKEYNIWCMNKRFWINPKYMPYYNTLKYDDLKKIKETITKVSKYGPDFRKKLGVDVLKYDFTKDPIYSWVDLKHVISNILRTARLNSNFERENLEPDISKLYGPFGEFLYNSHGDYIIVNSRGSIISHFSEDENTKKLKNELLPF